MGDSDTLAFGVLGPLEVMRGAESLTPSAPKQRALLALLLLNANNVVSTDRLIDDLWGEEPPVTAQAALQVHVSHLRRLLEPGSGKGGPHDTLVTRPPGYVLTISPEQLDLHRFERLTAEGATALAEGRAEAAAALLRDALALWRGPALADVLFEPFAEVPAARLEELRLGALERRLDADLARGRHAEVVGELQELCTEHPLREGCAVQLMLALYRSGRQAEALEAYQRARTTLVEELGIEPGPALQRVERDILTQDPGIDLEARGEPPQGQAPTERAVLVVADGGAGTAAALVLAEELALGSRPHELVLARLLDPTAADRLGDAAASLGERRQELEEKGVKARVATFTSSDHAEDIVRLASPAEVDLLLMPGPAEILRAGIVGDTLSAVLRQILCDVAFIVLNERSDESPWHEGPVLVPFGGGEHDWAALELGAWLAGHSGRELHLLGTTAETESGRRDASRLLADAGLLIQRVSVVMTVPRLVAAGHAGPLDAAADGGLLVIGLSDRWSDEGLGMTRWAIARSAPVPVLFVRRGLRPGGLAPDVSATRFRWSVAVGAQTPQSLFDESSATL
jgi:SARP family transcriptional regulator, regulator of embCAB operon